MSRKLFLSLVIIIALAIIYLSLSFGTIFINIFQLNNYHGITGSILLLRSLEMLMAFTVGGALAVAGVGYQAVLRNILADPFILGVSGGASIGSALAIISGIAVISIFAIPVAAFIGALAVLIIVILISRGNGIEYSNNIMLSGIIVGTVCTSILMFIISTSNIENLNSITWWMLGSLEPSSIRLLFLVFLIVIVCTTIMFFYAKKINLLSLGNEMSYYLGISPIKLTILILVLTSIMTASAVALSGIIGFVGLIIPHILRKYFGADHKKLIPLSLITGGLFLMICDLFARFVISPQVVPIGVITAAIGGPFFIWALNRKSGKI